MRTNVRKWGVRVRRCGCVLCCVFKLLINETTERGELDWDIEATNLGRRYARVLARLVMDDRDGISAPTWVRLCGAPATSAAQDGQDTVRNACVVRRDCSQ
jgi:hypothetical protein